MGRAPCCDKANVKKGPWSPEEDAKLKSYIEKNGTGGNWIALPQKIGLKRCGKSCRLRWLNYLRPNIKHGAFSEEEDRIICSLYVSIGSRWSIIAAQLPGRTDNDIKNYWNTRLKKKLLGKQRKEIIQARRGCNLKQEIKKESVNSFISNDNQTPYWPELPVLAPISFTNQEPRPNDHESIRNLLIKLGGRFSDHDDQLLHGGPNLQFPLELQYTHQIHERPAGMIMSSAQFAQSQTNLEEIGLSMLQGQSNCVGEVENLEYNNSRRGLDGLEFLYGDDMGINRFGTSACNWGEMTMSSLICGTPLYPSAYESFHQSVPEECDFSELRYPTTQ